MRTRKASSRHGDLESRPPSSRTGKKTKRISTAARPTHNTQRGPSVHNLPVEVLSMIFKEAICLMQLPLFAPGCTLHHPGWLVLLWICSRWRKVLIADASIWAFCYSHYPKLQEVFVARAGLVPLTYRLTASEPRLSPLRAMFRADEVELARFFAATPMDRCAEIYVSDGRGNDVADYLYELAAISIDRPLQLLRSLHLETWSWNWKGVRAESLVEGNDALSIIGDKIESVHLQNCWTVVSSPVLNRLTIIFTTNYQPRPSIHVFYHAMKVLCGGTLTHLELTNPVGGSYRDDIRTFQREPVNLPALASMTLVGYAPHIANILRILSWPREGTKLTVKTIVGDGPQQSFADEEDILRLCCSDKLVVRSLSVEHVDHDHLADRIILRLWSKDWSSNKERPPDVDTFISFGGAYMPCMWYETTMAVIEACKSASIRLLILALLPSDYQETDVPWEDLLLPMSDLRALYPWRRVMDSIGPVTDEHALGSSFRKRVLDFDAL